MVVVVVQLVVQLVIFVAVGALDVENEVGVAAVAALVVVGAL